MGIVGWADAANQADAVQNQETPISGLPTSNTESKLSITKQAVEDPVEKDFLESLKERASDSSAPIERDGSVQHLYGAQPTNQLISAVHNLRLAKRESENSVIDISKFELHELLFLYEHASRVSQVDPYEFVCEVFAVKHRIMDEVNDIDLVSSPNLDELLKFAEGKYLEEYADEETEGVIGNEEHAYASASTGHIDTAEITEKE